MFSLILWDLYSLIYETVAKIVAKNRNVLELFSKRGGLYNSVES